MLQNGKVNQYTWRDMKNYLKNDLQCCHKLLFQDLLCILKMTLLVETYVVRFVKNIISKYKRVFMHTCTVVCFAEKPSAIAHT